MKIRKLFSLMALQLVFWASAIAQTGTITGRVTDASNGSPLPYITVAVKGANTKTTTDENGNYSIKVLKGSTLTISGVGIESQSATITTDVLNFSVNKVTQNLGDVVVTTALGVKRQPKELGYSTTRVTGAEMDQAKVTNIATGLAGKVSGLQVSLVNNGVNPEVRVVLRGNRSILGNNQALLVLDGVQLPISYLNSISPEDIESVNILKGASASALYGSDASNGVMIVTTKSAKKGGKSDGKPIIRYSSTVNLQQVAYMPQLQNRFGAYGGETPGDPGTVTMANSIPSVPYVSYENQSYGPEFNGQKVPLGAPVRIYNADGTYTTKLDSGIYSAIPDAKRKFFDIAVTTINHISYASSDEKGSFFFSAENMNAKGTLPKDKSDRNTFRLSGSRTTGIFEMQYNIGYTLLHTNTTPGSGVPFKYGTTGWKAGYTPNGISSPSGIAYTNATTFATGGSYFQSRPVYWTVINTPANIDLRRYRDWQNDPFANPNGYFNAYYGNPWWQIDNTRLDEKSNDLLANLNFNLKPTKWLTIRYELGIARNDYKNQYTRNGFTFADWAIADVYHSSNIAAQVKKLDPQGGTAGSYNQRLSSQLTASFQKDYGDISVKFLAGTSLIQNTMGFSSMYAAAMVVPDFFNISNRVGEPIVNQYEEKYRKLGVYGDLTLGYKGYLFLEGTLRNDWTSLLAPNNRSFLYPSVNASFVFTDALKMFKDKSTILSFGKLRAAYSQTAQVSIDPYALQNVFSSGAGFPFGNVAGYTVGNTYANPNIKPEKTDEVEFGLELGFLKNRINFSAAVYSSSTTNQTIPISISSATGYTRAYVNSGKMTNKGIELDLRVTPVLKTKSGFKWDVGINFAYNKNRVVSIGYGLNEVLIGAGIATVSNSYAVVSLPYPILKVKDWERDPQGRIIVNSETGNPKVNTNLQNFGTTVPPTTVGFNTSFSFKGFVLGAVVDARFGAVIYNALGADMDFTGVSAYSAQSGRQPFVIPNSVYKDAAGNYVPNTNITTQNGNNTFWANIWNKGESNYINSANFWKLRELTLTYNFNSKIIQSLKYVKGLSLGIVARNLIVIRSKGNLWSDPEFSTTNGNALGTSDINQLPPTRFYGINLSITF